MSAEIYNDDGYYAIIPEEILFADISAQAVRLYAVLRRYADQRTMHSHPSRRALAEKLCVKSEHTVDRAVTELVELGVLSVFSRFTDDGDQTSNGYRIHRFPVKSAEGGALDGPTPLPIEGPTPYPPSADEPQPVKPQPVKPQKYGARPSVTQPRKTRDSKFQPRDPDDETSAGDGNDAPVLGASREPRTGIDRNAKSMKRGISGQGLALRLQRGLMDAGVPGLTNVGAVAKNLNAQHKTGMSWELLGEMVDLFVRNREAYTQGTAAPWKQFFSRTGTLSAHSKNILAARRINETPAEYAAWKSEVPDVSPKRQAELDAAAKRDAETKAKYQAQAQAKSDAEARAKVQLAEAQAEYDAKVEAAAHPTAEQQALREDKAQARRAARMRATR